MTAAHLDLAEAAWAWTLDQVTYDDVGPLLPDEYPFGMHSGIGGLAHALTRVARVRSWAAREATLADAVADRLARRVAEEPETSYFDGLVSHLEALSLLGRSVDACVDRLLALTPADWEHRNDVTLGTGAVVHGGLVASSPELVAQAAGWLLAEAEETPDGHLNWLFVPRRHVPPDRLDQGRPVEMPNFSHGLAGIATVLCRAGVFLGDPALVDAARRGAEHFVSLAAPELLARGALAVPRRIPWNPDHDEYTWNWCHGPAGSLALFVALEEAGVESVAGDPPAAWLRRCLEALRTSGIPARLHPGFWDNDGRCCGTAGVGAAVLPHDPDLARSLADALAASAHVEGERAYWRSTEHRAPEPLLPPGPGWMQGAAGIAGFLFEVAAT